jgi:FixJ family two-component response regulator
MTQQAKPHVYLIDSDEGLLDSVSSFLEETGYSVSSSISYLDFLENYDSEKLSCLVMDINTPELGGLGFQTELLRRKIITPIIFMADELILNDLSSGLKSGAIDFIKKPIDVEFLITLIEETIQKNLDLIECHNDYGTNLNILNKITLREREVLDLLSEGFSHKKIAKLMDISFRTVETHIQHLKTKTDCDISGLVIKNVKNKIYLKLNPHM